VDSNTVLRDVNEDIYRKVKNLLEEFTILEQESLTPLGTG
jgi:hypothetical protein